MMNVRSKNHAKRFDIKKFGAPKAPPPSVEIFYVDLFLYFEREKRPQT